jgi:hypothetical protein
MRGMMCEHLVRNGAIAFRRAAFAHLKNAIEWSFQERS